MALFKSSQLRKYKYCVSSCIIMYNGKAESLKPDNVTGMQIINDYIENTFPVFKLNLQIKRKLYYDILKNKNDVKVHLKIQKYYKIDFGNKKKKKKSPKKTWLDETFVLIMDENSHPRAEDIDNKNDKVEKKKKKGDASASGDNENSMELYLYRPEVASSMKKQVNIIFKKTNLISAVTYLLGLAGIRNVICAPFENNTEISQLFIPPLSINRAIQYLDIMYGFYANGSVIYYGLQYSYILNFKGGCNVYPSGDKKEVTFLVPKKSSTEGVQGGSVAKASDKYYICLEYDQMSFSNESISSDVINGTDAIIIDPNDASIETTSSTTITNGSSNYRSIENSTANKYLGTTYAAQTSACSNIITGSIVDCDIEAFEPYRLFNFVFEDSKIVNKYNGKYFLSQCSYDFVNESGKGEFDLQVGLTLRKMESVSSTKKTM